MIPFEIRVGVDGSPSSHLALEWAAVEAASRNTQLVVVHAYDWRLVGARAPIGGAYADAERERAEALVASAVAEARTVAPGVNVRGEAVLGAAGPVLVNASGKVGITVVGSRGRGGFSSLLLGSVSQQVATHAEGNVVVVRGRRAANGGSIVVGVDGSPAASDALAVAFDEAIIHHAGVLAVRTYSSSGPAWGPDVPPYVEDPVLRRENELRFLTEDIAAWREKYPEVAIEPVVIEGHTASVLADLSATAQMVVVGTRGHGGFSGLLLGSVGLQLLHHAQSPVLIVRKADTTR